jgi:competence protein ComEA
MEMQEADTGQSPRSQIENMTNASLSTGHQNSSESNLVVDVKGAVYSPGVYTLTSGDRVIDAIEQAGGLLTEASTLPINLAQPLVDGMVIYVPTQDEVLKGEVSVQGQWTSERISTTGSGKININQASVDQLQELPGIGPARAEAIVRYREEHGPFTSLDEITNVPGIGQKILENIMDHIEL